MTYYRVKPQYDNKRKPSGDDIYIANELYTEREVQRQLLHAAYLEKVEIPKSKIYFMFGARFAV